jgi:hypothetical protein
MVMKNGLFDINIFDQTAIMNEEPKEFFVALHGSEITHN